MSKKQIPAPKKWADDASIVENPEQNGIELRFNAEPHPELQSKLRAMGFRPGKWQLLWYAGLTPANKTFAEQVTAVLPETSEGPRLQLSPSFEAIKTNIEKKDFSFVMVSLKDGDTKNYVVFEPSKPRAEVIATDFARNQFGENFLALAVKPRSQMREARVLFEEGKIIHPMDSVPGQVLPQEEKKEVKDTMENIEKTSDEKIPLKEIWITPFAESRTPDYLSGKKFKTWPDANRYVKSLIGTYADAYYKVRWEDWEWIEGAIDLQPQSFFNGKEDVVSWHIKTFYTNLANHTPDVLYGVKAVEFAKLILANYQLFPPDGQVKTQNEELNPPVEKTGQENAGALTKFQEWLDTEDVLNRMPDFKNKSGVLNWTAIKSWFKEHYPGFSETDWEAFRNSSGSIGKLPGQLKKEVDHDELKDEPAPVSQKNVAEENKSEASQTEVDQAELQRFYKWAVLQPQFKDKTDSVSRELFDNWFKENYPSASEKSIEALWKSHKRIIKSLGRLSRGVEGKPIVQPYSSIYKKLLKVIPDLLENIAKGKWHAKSVKDPKGGLMDLNFDYLGKDKNGNPLIALSHYFKQAGDMVPDPDMQIRVLPKMEAAEALTYQDQFVFQEVYPDKGDGKIYVRPKLKRQLNSFLNQWLSNLINQGHVIDLSNVESETEATKEETKSENQEEDYFHKGYDLLCKFIPGLEAFIKAMNSPGQHKFVTSGPDKKIVLIVIGKYEERSLFIEEYHHEKRKIQYDVDLYPDHGEARVDTELLSGYFAGRYDREDSYEDIQARGGDYKKEITRGMCQWLEERIAAGYKIDLADEDLADVKPGSGSFDYVAKGVTGELTFNPYIMARFTLESKENLLYSIYGSRFEREHLKGRLFSPEEILLLKNMFIRYVLGKEHMEMFYDVLYRKEDDRHYDVNYGVTYSKEVQEKNEREKNGWIHTLSECQTIKRAFNELGLSHYITGAEAFEKNVPVIDLVHRYYDMYAEYEEKIEKPLKAEIARLNKKILSHKNDKSKHVGKIIKDLKAEADRNGNKIQEALKTIEDENLVFQDEVWDEVRNLSLALGYKPDDPALDIVAYRDDIMLGLFDDRQMENYAREPVKKMAELFIREFFETGTKEDQQTEPGEDPVFEGYEGEIRFNPVVMSKYMFDDVFLLMQFGPKFQLDILSGTAFSAEEVTALQLLFNGHVLEDSNSELAYKEVYQKTPDKKYTLVPFSRYAPLFLDMVRETLGEKASRLKTDAISTLAGKRNEAQSKEQIALADTYDNLGNVHDAQLQNFINEGKVPGEILKEANRELLKRPNGIKRDEPSAERLSKKLTTEVAGGIKDIVRDETLIPGILIPIGVREPFISRNFKNRSKEVKQTTDLKEITDATIMEASPQQLFELIQLTHPGDYGIKVSRLKLMQAFELKGKQVFEALGYPTGTDYPYVNIYSGYKNVETLDDIIHEYGDANEWWAAAENYRPVGDMKRVLEFIAQQIEKESGKLNALINPKTGKAKGKDASAYKEIEFEIKGYKESEQVIKDYLENRPKEELSEETGIEPVQTDLPLTNDVGVYTKETAGKNLEEINIPFPIGAKYGAGLEIVKTGKGDFRIGRRTAKKFGDSHGGGYAPSVDGESFDTREAALTAGLIEIKQRLATDLKNKDTILNNEEVKNKRVLQAIEALEKFASENGISLEKVESKKDDAPQVIIKGLEPAYWTDQDEEHPVDKITINGVAFHQARLRSSLLKKFAKLPIDTQLSISDELGDHYQERKTLTEYLENIKSAKGDEAKKLALRSYLDDMIIDNDLANGETGVLTSLFNRLTLDGETLADLPQVKTLPRKTSGQPAPRPKNQLELNTEIEALIDARDKKGQSYTGLDKLFISQYTGSGGLIKQGATGRGVLYEYYTPDEVVKKMWGLAYKYGYSERGAILEPAVGTGNFLKYAPKGAIVFGFETNHYAARISQVCYPTFHIQEKSFETLFFAGNIHLKDDFNHPPFYLVIGNPPYGEFTGKYAGMGEKKWTGALQYEHYFMLRGLDLLASGGLLVFIIPSNFLENGEKFNKTKEKILAKADLIDAYRLPVGIFNTTDIGTDIIVLKKKTAHEN